MAVRLNCPLFFTRSILLFDIVVREETLKNVIRSVTRNGKSILLTALFALILVYLFSIAGFLYLREVCRSNPGSSIFSGCTNRFPSHSTVAFLTHCHCINPLRLVLFALNQLKSCRLGSLNTQISAKCPDLCTQLSLKHPI
jgi:hypothetical protein